MADIRITPASSVMAFTSSLNYKETLTQEASGSLTLLGSGSTGRTDIFSVDGNNGRLFSVSDDLSNSLFSVNTIAGLPVIEAFADNTVVMGQYGQNVLVVTGSNVGVGTSSPNKQLTFSQDDDDAIQIRRLTTSQGNPSIGTGISWTWADSSSNNETWAAIRVIMPGSGNSNMTFSTTPSGGASGLTERMRITDAGNVGIGVTSPTTKLHVLNEVFIGNSSALRGIIISGDTNSRIDFNYNSISTGQITCGNTSNLFIDALGSRAIEFAIAGTSKMEVSPNGNVGIGTAGSVDPSAALEVKSNTQGFLLPRMDDGEMNSIPAPAIGLMVYNTSDDYVYVFGGASWAKLAYV